jgi:hypothetical protein
LRLFQRFWSGFLRTWVFSYLKLLAPDLWPARPGLLFDPVWDHKTQSPLSFIPDPSICPVVRLSSQRARTCPSPPFCRWDRNRFRNEKVQLIPVQLLTRAIGQTNGAAIGDEWTRAGLRLPRGSPLDQAASLRSAWRRDR